MAAIRVFSLVRREDESGVSGTGRVLDGIVFHSGQVVVCWRGDVKRAKSDKSEGKSRHSSLAIYPNWDAFKQIHIDAHPKNRSEVVFGNLPDLERAVKNSELLDSAIKDDEKPQED